MWAFWVNTMAHGLLGVCYGHCSRNMPSFKSTLVCVQESCFVDDAVYIRPYSHDYV